MGHMKDLFISMQEAYLCGADIEKETARKIVARQRQDALVEALNNFTQTDDSEGEEFNPDNEKHMEIVRETEQAIKENSYGEDE